DYVGIADFQRKERIGSVLDELCAVNSSDEEFRFAARGAGAVVHRTAKTALENRAVDLAEFRGGRGILDADNNPIRMEKISDRGAFAKKFGIGGHAVFHTADFGIGGEGAAEFETGARGDGTLFDDELGRFRFGGDLPGHVVDGGEVGLARFLRRRSHADEDGVSGADSFSGVSGIRDPSGFVSGREYLAEIMLVDGNAHSIELGGALAM